MIILRVEWLTDSDALEIINGSVNSLPDIGEELEVLHNHTSKVNFLINFGRIKSVESFGNIFNILTEKGVYDVTILQKTQTMTTPENIANNVILFNLPRVENRIFHKLK